MNPIDCQSIFDEQKDINKLLRLIQTYHLWYFNKVIDDKEIICYVAPGDDRSTQWKFALTDSMVIPTIHWFHAMLGHPGSCCMCATIPSFTLTDAH